MDDKSTYVVQLIQDRERELRDYLNCLGKKRTIKGIPVIVVRALNTVIQWIFPDDPVRTKNLEKVAGYLHDILIYLDSGNKPCCTELRTASLCSLLEQIKCPAEISSNNAWELADMLEIELIRLGDDPYLYTLLMAKLEVYGTDAPKDEYSLYEYLKKLHDRYCDGKFDCNSRLEVRRFLEHLQHNIISEYRRDRTKAQLRGIYLGRMALILTVLLFFFGYFYLTAEQLTRNMLFLVAFSGAIGSVLSRAYRLGKQPLHAETGMKTEEPPLGIRALISEWKVFIAQPVLGAVAALIFYLIFSSGILQIIDVGKLSAAHYGLIAFLAGFSEPFFTDIIDKVEGMIGGSKS